MEAIEKEEAELKKRLEGADTLDERRALRKELRELRKKAEELQSKKDLNANIVTEEPKKESKDTNSIKPDNDTKQGREDSVIVRTAEERAERRRRREAILNKEKEEQKLKEEAKEQKKEEKKEETKEEKKEEKKEQKREDKKEERKEDRKDEKEGGKEDKVDKSTTGEDLRNEDKAIESKNCQEDNKSEEKMNGPRSRYSFNKSDSNEGKGTGTRSNSILDKQQAKGAIGRALSVNQMRNKFGQGNVSKPVEFGSNFSKSSIGDKQTQPSKKEETKPTSSYSRLRETNTSESYRREVPKPKTHHKTAPAGPAATEQKPAENPFAMPGMGGSAADRLAFFRQAAEAEKAKKEKQAERERLQSAPAELGSTETKENRSAPCKKKLDQKRPLKRTKSISSIVLDWCKEMIRDYGVEVKNFSSSWNNGMAFCALIHKFESDAFDFKELKPEDREHNFRLAFETANKRKNIPMLLDVEDMVKMKNPEPRSVQCYIQWIWRIYGPTSGSYNEEEIKAAQIA